MTTVLGTRVESLDRAVPAALLISDLHVPGDGGPVVAALQAALDGALQRRAALFVLGDLFDSYVCRGQVALAGWGDVAARFAVAVRGGIAITLLVGNRDFLLGPEFVRASGVRLVHGGLRGVIGGVDTLLLHGDELCQNDLPYQRAKRWLRSAPVRWLARRLPVRAALAAAERARAKSRQVIAGGDPERFLPTTAAVAAAFGTGAGRLVFGHIHRPCHGTFAAGQYWVLPAFDQAATALWLAPGQAQVLALDAGGGAHELPAWSPCPFAAPRTAPQP